MSTAPAVVFTHTHNRLGMPDTMVGESGYVLGTEYTPVGDVQRLWLGTSETNPKQVTLTNQYESGTRRLRMSSVTDTSHGYKLQELTYGYDDAGNILSISDPTTLGGTGKADFQCFGYDGYRRLKHAWTPKTANCATTARTAANLDGAAPYWNSYTYSDSGLRKTETRHTTSGDITTDYRYGENGHPPHALTSTSTPTTAAAAAVTNTYAYDPLGNTISRPGTRGAQTLTWDVEGQAADGQRTGRSAGRRFRHGLPVLSLTP
jgi:hypothetical protein